MADPRLWDAVAMHGRRISALTAPAYAVSRDLTATARRFYPNLLRIAAVADNVEAEQFRALGMQPVLKSAAAPGIDLAVAVLAELGIEPDAIVAWADRQQMQILLCAEPLAV
jgi:hypothetical protein